MSKSISSRAGRIWLMCIVLVCFLGATLSLFMMAGGGAIHFRMLEEAAVKLLGFYLPLLSLIGVFFFKGGQHEGVEAGTPVEAFFFALVVTSVWVLTPPLLLWSGGYIEDVLASIEKFKPFGDSLALGALGYFFSKRG